MEHFDLLNNLTKRSWASLAPAEVLKWVWTNGSLVFCQHIGDQPGNGWTKEANKRSFQPQKGRIKPIHFQKDLFPCSSCVSPVVHVESQMISDYLVKNVTWSFCRFNGNFSSMKRNLVAKLLPDEGGNPLLRVVIHDKDSALDVADLRPCGTFDIFNFPALFLIIHQKDTLS